MGCGNCCAKLLLILVNSVFLLMGLFVFAIGMFARFGSDSFKSSVMKYLESFEVIPQSLSMTGVQSIPTGGIYADFGLLLENAAIAMIVLGAFLLGVAIFGCFGACCGFRCCLIIYAVILILLFLIQLLCVILVFSGALDDQIRTKMVGTITDNFVGIDNYETYTVVWNFLMIYFECCGVNDYKDFDAATKWEKTREFDVLGTTVSKTLVTPIACCMVTGDFPNVKVKDTTCAIIPHVANSNFETGCYSKFLEYLEQHKWTAIGVVAALLFIQALLIAAAIFMYRHIGEEKNSTV